MGGFAPMFLIPSGISTGCAYSLRCTFANEALLQQLTQERCLQIRCSVNCVRLIEQMLLTYI